jgi:hypothetical protein
LLSALACPRCWYLALRYTFIKLYLEFRRH